MTVVWVQATPDPTSGGRYEDIRWWDPILGRLAWLFQPILWLLLLPLLLSGCTAAAVAGITFGMEVVSKATGVDASLQESIRNRTGGCVTWYLKPVPCPPPAAPAP